MLKSKTSLYILLPLVVIIWGIVIYRVVGAVSEEPETIENIPVVSKGEIKRIEKDTFSLVSINHDPFLGHYYKTAVPVEKKKIPSETKIEWPAVTYLGLVSDSGKSSKIHILQINGKQFLMEKGNSAEGIKIIGSRSNEVILLYKRDRKVFIKNN